MEELKNASHYAKMSKYNKPKVDQDKVNALLRDIAATIKHQAMLGNNSITYDTKLSLAELYTQEAIIRDLEGLDFNVSRDVRSLNNESFTRLLNIWWGV